MRTKFIQVALIIFSLSAISFAQSVVVTPKKTTYKRPNTEMEFKKTFAVIRPNIKGVNSVIAKKVETAISYEKNFEFNVQEEINEIQWLEEANYEIDYNKNGILGVTLTVIGSGAYPSEYSKPVIVNLKTGEKILAKNAFVKLSELAAKGKVAQKAEIKRAIVEIKKENSDEENPASLFENSDFTVKNLDEFTVSDKGITFWYDYGFPHVIQALEPAGRYFFSWVQLKPFIKRAGLLARFVR